MGEKSYPAAAVDQVWDYALDLKNFHETSHGCLICPVLVATEVAKSEVRRVKRERGDGATGWEARPTGGPALASLAADRVLEPLLCNAASLGSALAGVLAACSDDTVDPAGWEAGRVKFEE